MDKGRKLGCIAEDSIFDKSEDIKDEFKWDSDEDNDDDDDDDDYDDDDEEYDDDEDEDDDQYWNSDVEQTTS